MVITIIIIIIIIIVIIVIINIISIITTIITIIMASGVCCNADHSSACRSNHRPENVSRWTVWANTRYKVCSTSHTKCTSHLHQKLLNSLLHTSWWYSIRTLLRGGIYWVVHPRRPRDFPRVKPQGLLEVGGEVQPIPHHQQGRIGLTLSILCCPQGSISWSTPCKKIDDWWWENVCTPPKLREVLGNPFPPPSRFRFLENLSVLRKSLGRQG